jgi:hypothetical protein
MDQQEQQRAFANDIRAVIDRYGNEFDMTYASLVGILEIEKAFLIDVMMNMDDGDEYEEASY